MDEEKVATQSHPASFQDKFDELFSATIETRARPKSRSSTINKLFGEGYSAFTPFERLQTHENNFKSLTLLPKQAVVSDLVPSDFRHVIRNNSGTKVLASRNGWENNEHVNISDMNLTRDHSYKLTVDSKHERRGTSVDTLTTEERPKGQGHHFKSFVSKPTQPVISDLQPSKFRHEIRKRSVYNELLSKHDSDSIYEPVMCDITDLEQDKDHTDKSQVTCTVPSKPDIAVKCVVRNESNVNDILNTVKNDLTVVKREEYHRHRKHEDRTVNDFAKSTSNDPSDSKVIQISNSEQTIVLSRNSPSHQCRSETPDSSCYDEAEQLLHDNLNTRKEFNKKGSVMHTIKAKRMIGTRLTTGGVKRKRQNSSSDSITNGPEGHLQHSYLSYSCDIPESLLMDAGNNDCHYEKKKHDQLADTNIKFNKLSADPIEARKDDLVKSYKNMMGCNKNNTGLRNETSRSKLKPQFGMKNNIVEDGKNTPADCEMHSKTDDNDKVKEQISDLEKIKRRKIGNKDRLIKSDLQVNLTLKDGKEKSVKKIDKTENISKDCSNAVCDLERHKLNTVDNIHKQIADHKESTSDKSDGIHKDKIDLGSLEDLIPLDNTSKGHDRKVKTNLKKKQHVLPRRYSNSAIWETVLSKFD